MSQINIYTKKKNRKKKVNIITYIFFYNNIHFHIFYPTIYNVMNLCLRI